jgi:hypothetical protein
MAWPCTNVALLLQRNRIASASSWGVAMRFIGAIAIAGARAAAGMTWVIGVLGKSDSFPSV